MVIVWKMVMFTGHHFDCVQVVAGGLQLCRQAAEYDIYYDTTRREACSRTRDRYSPIICRDCGITDQWPMMESVYIPNGISLCSLF